MTAEADRESPKFDIHEAYSRDEFIYRMELLLLEVPEGDSFAEILKRLIEWAERHNSEAVIHWQEVPNGDIFPYVKYELIVDPRGLELDAPDLGD